MLKIIAQILVILSTCLITINAFAEGFDRDFYLQSLKRENIWLEYYPVYYEPSGLFSFFDNGRIDVLISRQNKKPIYPKYAVIGFPGGEGLAHIELKQSWSDGNRISGTWNPAYDVISSFWAWGFPERARDLFIDDDFIFAYTDTTSNVPKVSALIEQLQKTFKNIKIYIHGISKGTYASMSLGDSLDGKVAGFIHSSAMNAIQSYRTDNKKSRHLLLHHKKDACDGTLLSSSEINRERFGTELIIIDNDIEVETGDKDCGPFTYHGYFKADEQAVNAIKTWIRKN